METHTSKPIGYSKRHNKRKSITININIKKVERFQVILIMQEQGIRKSKNKWKSTLVEGKIKL
jgi:hypothetical protein